MAGNLLKVSHLIQTIQKPAKCESDSCTKGSVPISIKTSKKIAFVEWEPPSIFILFCFLDCLGSLVVLSATATLEVLGSNPRSSKSVIWFFYEILSSSLELGFVPG